MNETLWVQLYGLGAFGVGIAIGWIVAKTHTKRLNEVFKHE